jgi:hypothetical protein
MDFACESWGWCHRAWPWLHGVWSVRGLLEHFSGSIFDELADQALAAIICGA